MSSPVEQPEGAKPLAEGENFLDSRSVSRFCKICVLFLIVTNPELDLAALI